MNEGQNGGTGFGTGNFGVPGGSDASSNMTGGVPQGMQRPTRMPSGMRPMSPVSRGQGDIILAPEKKSRKKLFLIIAMMVGVVVAVVLVVMMINRGGNNNNIEYTGLRGAFNRYANYFLTGDESTKDIEIPEEGDLPEEDGSATEGMIKEDDSDIIPWSGESDDIEELDEEELGKAWSDVDPGFNAYFYRVIESEGREEYVNNLLDYFDDFREKYRDEIGDDYNDPELINEYENELYLVIISYGAGALDQDMILNSYLSGGEAAANDLINKVAEFYSDLKDVYEVNYSELILNYGQQELLLIKKYQEFGCVADGKIDSICAEGISDGETLEIAERAYEYESSVTNILRDCSVSIYNGIYSFAGVVYEEQSQDGEE